MTRGDDEVIKGFRKPCIGSIWLLTTQGQPDVVCFFNESGSIFDTGCILYRMIEFGTCVSDDSAGKVGLEVDE